MALLIEEASFEHLPEAEIDAWSKIPTAVISDDMNRTNTMHAAIKSIAPGRSFAGQALPVQTMVGDNGTLHYALASAWPGCVMVVDGRAHLETAIWGGILNAGADAKAIRAVVIDGAVRDAEELRESSVSIFARAVIPNGPHKGFGGSINLPIQCAGVSVTPGDLVVGDEDGVVVIPLDQLPGLMAKCEARISKEERFLKEISKGTSTVELMGLPPADQIG